MHVCDAYSVRSLIISPSMFNSIVAPESARWVVNSTCWNCCLILHTPLKRPNPPCPFIYNICPQPEPQRLLFWSNTFLVSQFHFKLERFLLHLLSFHSCYHPDNVVLKSWPTIYKSLGNHFRSNQLQVKTYFEVVVKFQRTPPNWQQVVEFNQLLRKHESTFYSKCCSFRSFESNITKPIKCYIIPLLFVVHHFKSD